VLLKDRNAVVYGAGGSIGRAAAIAFAREGANVQLAGRTRSRLEEVAAEVGRAGGTAEVAELDALDEQAVDEHADAVAARHMIRQRSGVILMFGGYGAPQSDFHLGGFQVGLTAVDALRRQLAAELGPHGVRVLTIQSTGIGDETARTMLGRPATLEDVGNVAAFAASDRAAAMTATALNITCGDEVD
jgi:3-oxoacyl-[acyl-carrier protein] reductase